MEQPVQQAIQLFGFLILTFLGIVVPILVILLSVFQEGIQRLTTQYENERSQSEKNINEQLKKIGEAGKTNVPQIEESLKQLKAIKKTAEAKLSYLRPKKQILRLLIPLLISFLAVICAILVAAPIGYVLLCVAISVVSFTYTAVVLWTILGVIIEVRKNIEAAKKDADTKTVELLSGILDKVEKGVPYFLKNVYISIQGIDIRGDKAELTLSAGVKQELKVRIDNLESRMAKNVEVGFTFSSDFIIEKTTYYSLSTDTTTQVVRYVQNFIQGSTVVLLQPLIVTPLKQGSYKVYTFIKAENIEATYRVLNLTTK